MMDPMKWLYEGGLGFAQRQINIILVSMTVMVLLLFRIVPVVIFAVIF